MPVEIATRQAHDQSRACERHVKSWIDQPLVDQVDDGRTAPSRRSAPARTPAGCVHQARDRSTGGLAGNCTDKVDVPNCPTAKQRPFAEPTQARAHCQSLRPRRFTDFPAAFTECGRAAYCRPVEPNGISPRRQTQRARRERQHGEHQLRGGDNWGSGFVGNMTVPGGSQGLQGWTLEFDADFDISSIWGAEIVSHVGNHYVIRNARLERQRRRPAARQASASRPRPAPAAPQPAGLTLNGAGDHAATASAAVCRPSRSPTPRDRRQRGTTQLTFTVTLSQAATAPVTVHYATRRHGHGRLRLHRTYGHAHLRRRRDDQDHHRAGHRRHRRRGQRDPHRAYRRHRAPRSPRRRPPAPSSTTMRTPPPPAGGPSLDYSIVSNWGSGFTGAMTVGGGSSGLHRLDGRRSTATATISSIWNADDREPCRQPLRGQQRRLERRGRRPAAAAIVRLPGDRRSAATPRPRLHGQRRSRRHRSRAAALPTLSVADATVTEGNSGTRISPSR